MKLSKPHGVCVFFKNSVFFKKNIFHFGTRLALGPSCGCLGGVLGAPWGHLGGSWGVLGASRERLGSVLGRLGGILAERFSLVAVNTNLDGSYTEVYRKDDRGLCRPLCGSIQQPMCIEAYLLHHRALNIGAYHETNRPLYRGLS